MFLKSRIAILDVISEYATLKRAGTYYKGRCPFHHEKTGSFTVSPHREIYYCFGCHRGGDLIAFIQEAERCTPLEAARHLAQRYSITLPADISWEKGEQSAQKFQGYTALCSVIAQWCNDQVRHYPIAAKYLETRGINPASISRFQLGYFPEHGIKPLLEHCQKQGFLARDIIEARILFEGKHELYSPFEDRIIFPIKDHLGRICGFGGRIFKENDLRPKYYNSQESANFSKGTLLFGMDQAKKAIQEHHTVFLVEGYLDCIAMVQAGYVNTIATLGTACTPEHLKAIARYAQRLYIVYDGDSAGQQAIMRLTQLMWQVSLELFVISLPHAQDPASYLQSSGNMATLIARAEDIFLFFINRLSADYATKPLQERMSLVHEFLQVIVHIDDQLKQSFLIEQAANTFNIPLSILRETLSKQAIRTQQPEEDQEYSTKVVYTPTLIEQKLCIAILHHTTPIIDDDERLIRKNMEGMPKSLLEKLLAYNKIAGHSESNFLDTLTPAEREIAAHLLIEGEAMAPQPLTEILKELAKKEWKMIMHDIKLRLSSSEKAHDTEAIMAITKEFDAAKKKMRERGIL